MKKIPFSSHGGYRLFCESGLIDLLWWLTGVSWTAGYNRDDQAWWQTLHVRRPGWVGDCATYWHRARYGWAPRDTWNLNNYLNDVLAGSLKHLAEKTHGTPNGYPHRTITPTTPLDEHGSPDTDHEQWVYDLRRWARAFEDAEWWEDHDIDFPPYQNNDPDWVKKQQAVDEFFSKRVEKALCEMAPWWRSLWD